MDEKVLVVYCSPAGSTAHVAGVIGETLSALDADVYSLNLGKARDWSEKMKSIASTDGKLCLFIGSPVYASHAVPPVMSFIDQLPLVERGYGIPFVTWGGVSSGIALWEMGKAMMKKGFTLAGAAKVLGVHSIHYELENPLGKGHPDREDDRVTSEFVKGIFQKIRASSVQPLPVDTLDYQLKEHADEMKGRTFEMSMKLHPRQIINDDKCTRCGECVDACPVGAISMHSYPKFGENCIGCLTCRRLCPEKAVELDLSKRVERIFKRAKVVNERPFTKVFLHGNK